MTTQAISGLPPFNMPAFSPTTAMPNPASATVGFQGVQGGGVKLMGLNDDQSRLKTYGEQLVLIAGDNSGSMSGSKAQEANVAVAECMRALADPANKDGFRVSFVSYGSRAALGQSGVDPNTLQAHLDGNGGGTNLAPALRIISQEMDNYRYRSGRVKQEPVVIVFSDGCLGDTAAATAEATALKAKGAKIITIGFGSDVDAPTLQAIASEPNFYAFANVGQLKSLFALVGKTLSQRLAQFATP